MHTACTAGTCQLMLALRPGQTPDAHHGRLWRVPCGTRCACGMSQIFVPLPPHLRATLMSAPPSPGSPSFLQSEVLRFRMRSLDAQLQHFKEHMQWREQMRVEERAMLRKTVTRSMEESEREWQERMAPHQRAQAEALHRAAQAPLRNGVPPVDFMAACLHDAQKEDRTLQDLTAQRLAALARIRDLGLEAINQAHDQQELDNQADSTEAARLDAISEQLKVAMTRP
jgi:hypothetical protein